MKYLQAFVGMTGFEPATTRPPGACLNRLCFCIYLIYNYVISDNQQFKFYNFSSISMILSQNVVDLL